MRQPGSRARFLTLLAVAAVLPAAVGAQALPRRANVPLDAATTIVEAFRTHSIVALGEGAHGNEQGHAFRLALVRDPQFQAVVDDIVIESGTARYQDVVDRFVRGDDVPIEALRHAWEDTVSTTAGWERPIYEAFIRAVRDVNRARRDGRILRILLGDPPIDWAQVRSVEDYRKWLLQRAVHPADVIRREVLGRNRRALVIYGDGHFQARTERPGRSLAALIESSGVTLFNVTSAFGNVTPFQPNVASWRAPALTMLAGTAIGAAPYDVFFGPPPPTDFFRAHPRIEDHFDAVVYLGPQPTIAPLGYPRCADPDYVAMRVARMILAGMPPTVKERLAKDCDAARR